MANTAYAYGMPFVIGGSSGIVATVCVQPLDMIKVRMQLASGQGALRPSSLTTINNLLAQGGLAAFYQGLSAALARQIVYGTARLGLYSTFESALKRRAEQVGQRYSFRMRALAGVGAGALGSAIGNPIEVALIRMQSDGLRSVGQRAGYRSVVDALRRIVQAEGIRALWSGCSPTIVRAMCTNFGQLAFFSETKSQLQKRSALSNRTQSLVASAVGGFFAAFFSMPADNIKSKLQSQQRSEGSVLRYRGVLHCFMCVVREQGPTHLYAGFPAYVARMAPHS